MYMCVYVHKTTTILLYALLEHLGNTGINKIAVCIQAMWPVVMFTEVTYKNHYKNAIQCNYLESCQYAWLLINIHTWINVLVACTYLNH